MAARASELREPLRRACEYLWSQQAEDGGWHSGQYAVLRSGQALTPFVLYTLLGTIDAMSSDETGRVMKALEFIGRHTDEDGAVGRADSDILEYPVYSTAYSLFCLKRVQAYRHLRSEENQRLIDRMDAYLVGAQFDEGEGFTPQNVAYGGWGFDAARSDGVPGHMDLAHTRRAIQAIRAGRWLHNLKDNWIRGESKTQVRAQAFLRVVQKHPEAAAAQPAAESVSRSLARSPFEGGFYFSPVVLDANKGRAEDREGASFFRSYATATCDGVLALLAAGVPRDDERVVRAVEWLKQHDDMCYPDGIPTDHPEPWGEALRFYHYAVRAEAYAALDWPGEWRSQLSAEVARHQSAEGSFRNMASPLMKEDEPLLCTALAVIALSQCTDRGSAR